MEALNALGLKPICVLPDQRAKPRNFFQFPTFSPPKPSNSSALETNPPNLRENLSRNFQGSLAFLASAFSAKFASALTYEEALEQSVNSNSGADFDAASVVEIIVNNPLVIAGGVAVIALPLLLSQVLGGQPKAFGVESAKSAYAKLADDPSAQLLDIRSLKEVKEVGSPDVRGLKKKPVSIVYKGEDKPGFLKKLSLRFKEPENTALYILDKFDGNSELVAELVTANGFKSAYAIKDGAEGPRGWVNSGLPWILPKKTFNFDFSGLAEAFGGAVDEGGEALPVALGVAAAAGLGLLAFTEVETVLQLLGSAALIQVFSKKLLFAEERKQTLRQLDEFLTTKVAPKELVSDIKQIGSALLPVTLNNKSLPAPTEADSKPAAADNTVLKAEAALQTQAEAAPQTQAAAASEPQAAAVPEPQAAAVPEPQAEAVPEPQAEAATQPAAETNSAPQKEVKPESHQRALSPYPSYPDFKPPTSPCPSQP